MLTKVLSKIIAGVILITIVAVAKLLFQGIKKLFTMGSNTNKNTEDDSDKSA